MAKHTKTTNAPVRTVHVIHGPTGQVTRSNVPEAPRGAGEKTPDERFRESADRVLTEHKRALDWLRDK